MSLLLHNWSIIAGYPHYRKSLVHLVEVVMALVTPGPAVRSDQVAQGFTQPDTGKLSNVETV